MKTKKIVALGASFVALLGMFAAVTPASAYGYYHHHWYHHHHYRHYHRSGIVIHL